MIVEKVGEVLLLRSSTDPTAALTAMARALPAEPARLAMVSSPSITGRQDFFELMEQEIQKWDTDGIRLVMLGGVPAVATLSDKVKSLAQKTGREIVAPLGPVLVATDGTLCAHAMPEFPGGWLVCPPGGQTPSRDPAWFPLRAWAPRQADTAARRGKLTAQQVPAGYWILPKGSRAGSAGSAAVIDPDDNVAAVFVGGRGLKPSSASQVANAAREVPGIRHAALMLLPKALPPNGSVSKLAKLVPTRVTGAVPMRTAKGWKIAQIGPNGDLLWRLPIPSTTTLSAPVSRAPISRRRRTASPATGSPTPAGWSFVDGATPIGNVPSLVGPIVEISAGPPGFVVLGQHLAPAAAAELISSCGFPGPIVVVCHGEPPATHTFAALADALGVPITAADAEVSLTHSGRLHTSGRFRTWQPGQADVQLGGSELFPPPRTELVTDSVVSSAAATAPVAAAVEVLRGLPFVFGPVFAPHKAWAALRHGEEFEEVNRLEVVLRPASGPVIWSTSARRLNGDGALAVFAPGSRFRVLNAEPGCLLLLDMAGGHGEIDEGRLVQRMLSALAPVTSGQG